MGRLRITLELNKNRKEEVNLYDKLQNYSNPAAYIKDVLRGLLPIPGEIKVVSEVSSEEDYEDLMDI